MNHSTRSSKTKT